MKHDIPLSVKVTDSLETYFRDLEGNFPRDLYQMVMTEVEGPLFKVLMKYVRNNQSKAAEILGVSRGTLRKKLKQYSLDK